MATRPRSATRSTDRGQTSIDFLIGAAVFLLAVTFVFATIPGMIDPFSEGQEETLVADRIATQLAESMLGERDSPTTLNETCTYAFFNESLGSGDGCAVEFDESEANLATRVGISDQYRLNVTLRRAVAGGTDFEIICTDGDVVDECDGLSTRLAAGPTPSVSSDSVTSARRTVYVGGKDVTLVVRIW